MYEYLGYIQVNAICHVLNNTIKTYEYVYHIITLCSIKQYFCFFLFSDYYRYYARVDER